MHRITRITLSTLLIAGLLMPAVAGGADDLSRPLLATDVAELDPAIWGGLIALAYDTHGVGVHTTDGLHQWSSVGFSGSFESPDISDELVAWVDTSETPYKVRYRVLAGPVGGICTVPTSTVEQSDPAVWGDRIVWVESTRTEADIHMYDVSSGVHTVVCDAPGVQSDPDIYGDLVVWQDHRDTFSEIYLYYAGRIPRDEPNLEREHRLRTLHGPDPAILTNQWAPRIYKGTIAFEQDAFLLENGTDVWRFDLPTSTLSLVAGGPGWQSGPAVYENIIVYESADGPGLTDLYAYSMRTDTTKLLPVGASEKRDVGIFGNTIIWQDDMRGSREDWNDDVYSLTFQLPAERRAGTDRFSTSVDTSKWHFPTAETVVLATGYEFADALSASGLAGALEAPLLLTRPDSLPQDIRDEIDRLRAEKIVIIGGTKAVSAAIESALSADGFTVERISGANRFATAAAVADEIETVWAARTLATGDEMPSLALVARGDQFADALSGSPIAYNLGIPILLSRPDSLPSETHAVLTGLDDAVILGGTGAVSAGVQDAIDAAIRVGPSERWSGSDRYATAVAIVEEAVAAGYASLGYVATATGVNFPDALGGGAAAGANGGVLLLTYPTDLSAATATFLQENRDGIGRIVVFGGTGVVSTDVSSDLETIWGTDGAAIWGTDGAAIGAPVFFDDPAQYLP